MISVLAINKTVIPERLYWLLFTATLLLALALRVFWTYALQIPYVQPDTPSYYSPVIENWILPFSQMRTSGVSMFISASLLIFRHPAGILIVDNILTLGSGVLLALAIKTVLRQNLLSLVAMFAVLFTPKDLALEYFLMSEHYSRALYVVYAALVPWVLHKPGRLWLAALLGLVVTLNILVKPSAIVLTVATLMAFAVAAWVTKRDRSRVLAAAAVFLVANIGPMLGYMAAFKARYGTFSMTQYEGINQFSHMGHLIVVDGGVHPVLKERLKPLIVPYIANYASKGDYEPNWLIYGSVTADLKRDFGDKSPARTIREYVHERYGSEDLRWINQVDGDLALEAMMKRPLPYLRYAARRGFALWYEGYSFIYYQLMPNVPTVQRHRDDRILEREWLYQMYGVAVPPCGSDAVIPPRATGVPALLFQGPIATCVALPYENPRIMQIAAEADAVYNAAILPLGAVYQDLPKIGALAAVIAGLLLVLLRGRRIRNLYGYGLLLMLILFGYTTLLGLVNVADTQRMTANVQDFTIIASFVFILCVMLQTHRLVLFVIAVSRRRRNQSLSVTAAAHGGRPMQPSM